MEWKHWGHWVSVGGVVGVGGGGGGEVVGNWVVPTLLCNRIS